METAFVIKPSRQVEGRWMPEGWAETTLFEGGLVAMQAELVGIGPGQQAAFVVITARSGRVRQEVPWAVVPSETRLGERFMLRCTLATEKFAVAAVD